MTDLQWFLWAFGKGRKKALAAKVFQHLQSGTEFTEEGRGKEVFMK